MHIRLFLTLFACSVFANQYFYAHGKQADEFKTLEELYDFWAMDYKTLVQRTHYRVPAWFEIKKNLLPIKKQYVLDLGCADGMTGELLYTYRPAYRFFGVDFSRKMVNVCSQKTMYAKVIHADLNYGLPEQLCMQQYDLVFATGCLEFMQNHENLFAQIQKIIKPEGQFWLTLQVTGANCDKQALDKKLTLYTEQEARDILKSYGFMIIDLEFTPAAYISSNLEEAIPYFLIIAQKKS